MNIPDEEFKIKVGRNYGIKINRYVSRSKKLEEKNNVVSSNHLIPEINYFLEGSCKYIIGSGEYDVKKGDIVFVPPGVNHYFTNRSESIDYINIWFNPSCLYLGDEKQTAMCFEIFRKAEDSSSLYMKSGDACCNNIKTIVEMICNELSEKRSGYVQLVKIHLSQLTIELLRVFENNFGEVITKSDERERAIDRATEYIQDKLSQQFTLSELANVAHMSPKYFGSVFKEINGITPWEYIAQKKMELAGCLLCDTGMSVYDIAYECGYSNVANFNKVFKKHFNMAPGEYRKKNRGI